MGEGGFFSKTLEKTQRHSGGKGWEWERGDGRVYSWLHTGQETELPNLNCDLQVDKAEQQQQEAPQEGTKRRAWGHA